MPDIDATNAAPGSVNINTVVEGSAVVVTPAPAPIAAAVAPPVEPEPSDKRLPILPIWAGVTVVLTAAFAVVHWVPLPIAVNPMQAANILAPLVLTAAFIERAVETFISPLRDTGAVKLRHALVVARAVDPPDSAAVTRAQHRLSNYIETTRQYAFMAAWVMGLCAAFVGIRSLGVFLPSTTAPAGLGAGQWTSFLTFDVFLTASLLAGGANGLHAPINALTSFFNASAASNLNAAANPPQTSGQ